MKIETQWQYKDGKFINGVMSAELTNNSISIYVLDKKIMEFGNVGRVMDFSNVLKSLVEIIEG
jgi:uncharacterized protein YkvS